MVEFLIGTGGWGYFNVPGDRLKNYSNVFNTVEINSTFYKIPTLLLVKSWRKKVPEDFKFTVRCNREVIKKLQNDSVDSLIESFDYMRKICDLLKSDILHIQTSENFIFNTEIIDKIDDFLEKIQHNNFRLAWENRSNLISDKDKLFRTLKDHKIIHSVDLSKEKPFYESDIIYSRLFGKGIKNIYQFTNEELEEIYLKVKDSKADKAYLNFHGMRMYKDAARISMFEKTGTFPKITRSIGVDSIIELLAEETNFPSDITDLIRYHGWKVCEWDNGQQIRLLDIFQKLRKTRFNSLHELEIDLKIIIKKSNFKNFFKGFINDNFQEFKN